MDLLALHIEALVFSATEPVTLDELQFALHGVVDAEIALEEIQKSLTLLIEKYEQDLFSFSLVHIGGGYIFLTKPAYQAGIARLLNQKNNKKLSNTALETLSIIAYEQPVTKSKLEKVRGVNCDYSVQKLLEKELIEIKGKSDSIGRPILLGTSQKFMEYFGINHLNQLPSPKDFIDTNTLEKMGE